ncbi:hypothetical protein D3C78_1380040 [compost metagenome]
MFGDHLAGIVHQADVGGADRQTDGAVIVHQIVGADAHQRRAFGQAIAFQQRGIGQPLPLLGHRPLHRHAAAYGQLQPGEVHALEFPVVDQGVEQGVDPGDAGEGVLSDLFDEARDVARVADEQVVAPQAHEQQAIYGQREHVVER